MESTGSSTPWACTQNYHSAWTERQFNACSLFTLLLCTKLFLHEWPLCAILSTTGFKADFSARKAQMKAIQDQLFTLKGRLQLSFWYQRVLWYLSSIMQDVISIEISSHISTYKPSNYSPLDTLCNPIKSFQSREITRLSYYLITWWEEKGKDI